MKKILLSCNFLFVVMFAFSQENSDDAFKEFLRKSKGVQFKEDAEKKEKVAEPIPIPAVIEKVEKKTEVITHTEVKAEPTKQTVVPKKAEEPKIIETKEIKKETKIAEEKKPTQPTVEKKVASESIVAEPKKAVIVKTEEKEEAKTTVEKKIEPAKSIDETAHVFKDIKASYTLEGERKGNIVKIYIKLADIDNYLEVVLERASSESSNYTRCRTIPIEVGKYKNDIILTEDRFPLSTKVSSNYRITATTRDGVLKTFPPVTVLEGAK